VAAVEVMFATPAIRNLIREAKTPQINNAIMTSAQSGMITMDGALAALYHRGKITMDEGLTYCVEPESFRRLLNMR
jgi:twitching motility protein PilT